MDLTPRYSVGICSGTARYSLVWTPALLGYGLEVGMQK
jgi:hypothetical protein